MSSAMDKARGLAPTDETGGLVTIDEKRGKVRSNG